MKNPSYRSIYKESFSIFFKNLNFILLAGIGFAFFMYDSSAPDMFVFTEEVVVKSKMMLFLSESWKNIVMLFFMTFVSCLGLYKKRDDFVETLEKVFIRFPKIFITFLLIVFPASSVSFVGMFLMHVGVPVGYIFILVNLLLAGALVLAFYWIYAIFIVITGNEWGMKALRTSYGMIKGRWWAMFGLVFTSCLGAVLVMAFVHNVIFQAGSSFYDEWPFSIVSISGFAVFLMNTTYLMIVALPIIAWGTYYRHLKSFQD